MAALTPARTPGRAVAIAARVFSALAVLTAAGTYLAAQIDFVRRHTVGFPPMPPARYWLPQIEEIWVPGLGATFFFAGVAFLLHRRRPEN